MPKRSSKKDLNQLAAFIVEQVRVSPAMEAGISKHLWSIEEIVKLAE